MGEESVVAFFCFFPLSDFTLLVSLQILWLPFFLAHQPAGLQRQYHRENKLSMQGSLACVFCMLLFNVSSGAQTQAYMETAETLGY